jgi:hypothetical protein
VIRASEPQPRNLQKIDQRGAHRLALRYLSQAIQRGYGAELIASDPDLDSLRGLEAFDVIQDMVRLGQGS